MMKGMQLGMSASLTRTFTAADREVYRQLARDSADDCDERGHRLPEPLIGGMFSFILGTDLPGFGTNYLKQRMQFLKSAYFGETLTATVTIVRLRPEKNLVNLETTCHNAAGELVCSGEALVLAKDVQPREFMT
jgi:3-hydroxybutyryl-CoA dehydratase